MSLQNVPLNEKKNKLSDEFYFFFRIICQETIEERIELLQKKKLEVAETVLKGELTLNKNKMTLADLKILFDVHEK